MLVEHIARGVEGYGHAGNAAAKTAELCALFLRMARHQRRFDARLMGREGDPSAPPERDPYWIDLPGPPADGEAWRHWVLVQSYSQAKDSSMAAYRKLLGRWPHKIGWLDRGLGHIKLIKVRPENWPYDDPETWSQITFISQENMTDEDVRFVQGARLHSAQMDEIGLMSVWREIRARRIANAELYLGIGATPEYKHEWEEFYDDFRECLGRVVRGRIRVQWSVRDNRALRLEDIEKRVESYLLGSGKKSDLFDARVAGEHVDVSGSCPFPDEPMDRMLNGGGAHLGCRPGRLDKIVLRAAPKSDLEPDYRDILPAHAYWERWLPYEPTHSYLLVADTSRGIDDPTHDPAELELWDWTEPMVVGRFGMRDGVGGYLDEESLAILADKIGREYGNAMIDCEVTGQFGVQFILTLRKLGYPNLAHDDRALRPGDPAANYGWVANATSNGEIVNALINGLSNDLFQCWSRDMVLQWKDVREDEQGRPANVRKGARHHREAMVCAGRALHWITTRPAPKILAARRAMGIEAALRRDFGRRIPLPGRDVLRKQVKRPQIFRPQ